MADTTDRAMHDLKAQWRAEWEAEQRRKRERDVEHSSALAAVEQLWDVIRVLAADIAALDQSAQDGHAAEERGEKPGPGEDPMWWYEMDWSRKNGNMWDAQFVEGMLGSLTEIAAHYDAAAQREVIACEVLLERVVALNRRLDVLQETGREVDDGRTP